MRAAVAERPGEPLALTDVATPEPGPGEVLVQVKACGVCYTDLRIVDALGAAAMPLVPGHEPVGLVARVGAGVEGVRAGDRVAVHALFACGGCAYCRAGEDEACTQGFGRLAGLGLDGGYAEAMRVPAERVVPLPEVLSYAEAAPFGCAGLTSYAALRNGGIDAGQRVAVVGIGGLGHLAIPIAKALGAAVYAATSSPDKAATARDLGAAVAGDAATVAAALRERGGAHLVLHTANALDPLTALFGAIARQGAIVLTAADGETLPIPPALFTGLQLRVIGSFFGSRRDLAEVLALASEHGIRPLVERFPLADVNEVHSRLRRNDVRYRAVLEP